MPQEKLADPSWPFMQTMTNLYFIEEVTPASGQNAVETLPPIEALVLGMMCLTKTYNSQHVNNLFCRKYRVFSARECGILTGVGIFRLAQRGYLRPASKEAEKALNERDEKAWGLANVPFVVTAEGAARIGCLVANIRGGTYKEAVKELQAESLEAAKGWRAEETVSMPD